MQNYNQDFHFQAPEAPPAFQMDPFFQLGYQQDIEPVFQENEHQIMDPVVQENLQANVDNAFHGDWNNFNPAQLHEGWNDAHLAPNNVNLPPVHDRALLDFAVLQMFELQDTLADANNQIRHQDQEIRHKNQFIDDTYDRIEDYSNRLRVLLQEQEDEVGRVMREKDIEIERLKTQLEAERVGFVGDGTRWLRIAEGFSQQIRNLEDQRNRAVTETAKAVAEAAAEAARKDEENRQMQLEMIATVNASLERQRGLVRGAESDLDEMRSLYATISILEKTNANLTKKITAQQRTIQARFKNSMVLRRSKRVNNREAANGDGPRTGSGASRATKRRVRK